MPSKARAPVYSPKRSDRFMIFSPLLSLRVSYVCFPAGQAEPHYLVNTSTSPFSYIIVGERISDDEVTYPDGVDNF